MPPQFRSMPSFLKGTVNSIREFGAFLEILPGRDGLCHVSEISSGYIDNVADLIRVGDDQRALLRKVVVQVGDDLDGHVGLAGAGRAHHHRQPVVDARTNGLHLCVSSQFQ